MEYTGIYCRKCNEGRDPRLPAIEHHLPLNEVTCLNCRRTSYWSATVVPDACPWCHGQVQAVTRRVETLPVPSSATGSGSESHADDAWPPNQYLQEHIRELRERLDPEDFENWRRTGTFPKSRGM